MQRSAARHLVRQPLYHVRLLNDLTRGALYVVRVTDNCTTTKSVRGRHVASNSRPKIAYGFLIIPTLMHFGVRRTHLGSFVWPKVIFYGHLFTVRFGTKCSASAFVLQFDYAIERLQASDAIYVAITRPPILLKFSTEFDHMTADALQSFNVKGSKFTVITWRNVSAIKSI